MQDVGENESNPLAREQVAALPWRIAHGVEVMVISSRGTRRWVLPKGWPMKGKTFAQAAAREALEEAGLEGVTGDTPFGFYDYIKRLKNGASRHCTVAVFPMQVHRQRKNWPEKAQRTTRWMPVEEAAAAVEEADLRQLILDFGASITESAITAGAARG